MNARNRFPLRGGNWNNGSDAGLGALRLNSARSSAGSNIGFRPALDYARSSTLKGGCQCNFEKDAAAPAIAEKAIKPVDASTGCTYEQIYQFENILNAAYQCRKGKTTSASALAFFNNLEENIVQIQNELMGSLGFLFETPSKRAAFSGSCSWLKTNSKTQVFPIAKANGRSLDFLGYRIYASHRLLRKSSVKKISTKLKRFRKEFSQGKVSLVEINQCVQSWLGHASHADTHSIKLKLFNTPFKR
ncbi:MAG: hypothetical protein CML20_09425 [Rheinheimera sp.]|nr:hypothetical protein [Rheinheimera sp.]